MFEDPEIRKIGHDLVNLLAAVTTYAAMIADRAADDRTRADAEALRRAADRAVDLARSLLDRPQAAAEESGSPPGLPGAGERVLVVEDEPAIRELIVQVLTVGGYTVLEAGGPEEALAVLGKDGPVDLLLCDRHLPRMSGPDLAARVVEGSPRTGVLYVSGDSRDLPGASLLKPFTAKALLAKVREALDASAGS